MTNAAGRDFATMWDFIVGRMSDEERRAFEERLVRDPELVRELEQSLRMREGLQQLRTQGYFEKAGSRAGTFSSWAPYLAAAAVAGVALLLWLSRIAGSSPILVASLEARTATGVAPLVAAHFTFVTVRGGSAPVLDLPRAGMIEIRAAPSTRQEAQRYRLTLVRHEERGTAEPVAALAGLVSSPDGYVHCYADASRLPPGNYVLRIEPERGRAGMAELFPFSLRARLTESTR